MSNTSSNTTAEWKTLPWRKLEKRVFKLQKRIFRASNRGDVKAVRKLQKTLMKSWSGKCLAVRKVTQDNQGKKTAGVDGIKNLTKVQGTRSPFDGDLVYWGKRISSHPELSSRVATLLKNQAGKCNLCELNFKYGDLWEVDHVVPTSRGGKNIQSNLQLLHRHCHDRKSATDRDVVQENWDDNPF